MLSAAVVTVASFLLEVCTTSPVYNLQPAFITNSVGMTTGRNIRHLPCISRKNNNQSGVCMFAIDCLKANGTHLGTCIDRFYFGSCCHVPVLEVSIENTIDNDIIPQREPPMRLASTTKRVPTKRPPPLTIFGDKKPTRGTTTTSTTTSATTTTTTTTTTPPPTTAPPERLQTFQVVEDSTVPERLQTFQSVEGSIVAETTTRATPSTSTTTTTTTTTTTPTTTTPKPTTVTTVAPSSSTSRFPPRRPPTGKPFGANGTTAATIVTTTAFFSIRPKPTRISTTARPSKPTSKPTTKTTSKPVRATIGTTKKPITTNRPNVTTTTTTGTRRPVNTFRTTTTRRPVAANSTARPITTRRPVTTGRPLATSIGTTTTRRPVARPSVTSSGTTTTRRPVPRPSVTSSGTTTTRRPVTTATKPLATSSDTTTTWRPVTTVTRPSVTSSGTTTTRRPVTTVTRPLTTSSGTTTTRRPVTSATSITTKGSTTATTTGPPVTTAGRNVTSTTTERPATTVSSTAPTTQKPEVNTTSPASNEVAQGNVTTILDTINGNVSTNEIEGGKPKPTTKPEGIGAWEVDDKKNYTTPSFNGTVNTTTEDWVPITSPDAWVLLPSVSPSTTEAPTSTTTTHTTPSPTPEPTSTTSVPSSEEPRPPEGFFPVETTNVTTTEVPPATTVAAGTTAVPSHRPAVNMSDYTSVCGRRMYPEARIVGGEKSMFGRWPWQISVRQWRTSTYLHKCGAALLNENWAITAAHCVDSVPPSDLLLRLGEYDLSTESEPYLHQERRVQIIASHPQFDQRTFEYDLALLRFYEPVTFQPNILPVCVPGTDENFIGRTAHVTGWGRLYEDGPLPSVLQEVSVPVLNNSVCENMYESAGYIEHIPHIFICAGWRRGGYDSCEGDSGGPMVIQREDRRFVLAGIISWGIGCAEPNQPGVYTRVSEFRDWINQILQF